MLAFEKASKHFDRYTGFIYNAQTKICKFGVINVIVFDTDNIHRGPHNATELIYTFVPGNIIVNPSF